MDVARAQAPYGYLIDKKKVRNECYYRFGSEVLRGWAYWRNGNLLTRPGRYGQHVSVPICVKRLIRNVFPNLPWEEYRGESARPNPLLPAVERRNVNLM